MKLDMSLIDMVIDSLIGRSGLYVHGRSDGSSRMVFTVNMCPYILVVLELLPHYDGRRMFCFASLQDRPEWRFSRRRKSLLDDTSVSTANEAPRGDFSTPYPTGSIILSFVHR